MYKLVWIIVGFCVFLGITLGALTTRNLNYGKQVNFINVNLAVRNSNSQVINQTVTIPSQVVTQNTTLTTTTPSGANKNSIVTETTYDDVKQSTVNYEKKYSNQTASRKNTYSKKYKYDNTQINYKNIDDTELDNVLKNASTTTKSGPYGAY